MSNSVETDQAGETFLFADLAGFTALTEAHGDEESADLTNRFFSSVRELLPGHGAEEVKTIGDAVMIRVRSAAEAVRLGVSIVQDVGSQHGFPSIRAGMHTGPAAERSGDWFGQTVNTAARVSGVASGGDVLITDATHRAAGELEGIEFRERGRQELKNLADPVLLYVAMPQGARTVDSLPIDPVCRMAIAPDRAAGRITHQASSTTSARSSAPAPSRPRRSSTAVTAGGSPGAWAGGVSRLWCRAAPTSASERGRFSPGSTTAECIESSATTGS